ncbi:MAG: DUF937 domain-containing protein [Propionicimonas sp.]
MSQDAVDEILGGIDLRALAAQLGTDEESARQAAAAAIPTLLGSLQANTGDQDGRQSLLGALGQHTGELTDLDAIDTEDGRRILDHMFADDPRRLEGVAGQGGDLLAKLLPILAPIVMNWLARRVLGSGSGQAGGAGGLGDLLGGMLGGAPGTATGGGLEDLLGQILGGALDGSGGVASGDAWPAGGQQRTQGSGDILGGLLGQILGR